MKSNKKYNLYVTEMSSNGTRALIITDLDGQLKEYVDDAVFGGNFNAEDELGGVCGLINGESVGYFSYDHEALGWDDNTQQEISLDQSFAELLLEHGEHQGVELVFSVTLDEVLEYIAVSPVNDGSEVVNTLKKYFKI